MSSLSHPVPPLPEVTVHHNRPDAPAVGTCATAGHESGHTILVVNDAPEQLALLSHMLGQAGYSVAAASDGAEGLEMARSVRPDLILSDVAMPVMDGIEMCRHVRAEACLRLTPILLVSAMRKDSESALEGLLAGADDYIEAPYDPMRLIMKIARLVERKRAEEVLREADQRAVREYERLLRRIAQLAQTLGAAHNLAAVFDALRDFITTSTPCNGVLITLYDEGQNVRVPSYGWLDGREIPVKDYPPVPVGDGFAGRVVKTQTVAVTGDYQRELAGRYYCHINPAREERVPQSALIAPMTVKGQTVGTVEIQSYERSAYDHEHEIAMQMAANLAANAIDNVRLLEQEREKEEQLRQSQKMEAIGQLAGGVAHDFNNLLTAITMSCDLALRKLRGEDPLRRNLEEIKKAGERAAGLTRQLLAFSRKQLLKPKVLNLNEVVNGMANMLRRLIGEDIELIAINRRESGYVLADPGQLEQVLMNLAVNARDAMPHGGKLIIESENVVMDEQIAHKFASVRPGPHVRLTLTDTGCGMDEETQQRIFEPFFTTKEVGRGTGLGLSTVYGIIKQSNGYISVQSEVGVGTAFQIYLPQVDTPVVEKSTVHKAPSPGGAESILLVEDEQMVRQLTRSVLEMLGYTVLEAPNGDEALRLSEEHKGKIDLMLTDVVMPGMSGRQVAEQVKALRPEMKVLYMSGYTDGAIVHHGVLDTGTELLEKPFTPHGLACKVRAVLET